MLSEGGLPPEEEVSELVRTFESVLRTALLSQNQGASSFPTRPATGTSGVRYQGAGGTTSSEDEVLWWGVPSQTPAPAAPPVSKEKKTPKAQVQLRCVQCLWPVESCVCPPVSPVPVPAPASRRAQKKPAASFAGTPAQTCHRGSSSGGYVQCPVPSPPVLPTRHSFQDDDEPRVYAVYHPERASGPWQAYWGRLKILFPDVKAARRQTVDRARKYLHHHGYFDASNRVLRFLQ